MLFIYLRDSLRRIELSTAVKVAADAGDASLAAFLDGSNNVVARVRDEGDAAFARIDLGPVLQVGGSSLDKAPPPTYRSDETSPNPEDIAHQQAPEFTDSPEAQIPE